MTVHHISLIHYIPKLKDLVLLWHHYRIHRILSDFVVISKWKTKGESQRDRTVCGGGGDGGEADRGRVHPACITRALSRPHVAPAPRPLAIARTDQSGVDRDRPRQPLAPIGERRHAIT
jgi:hypothetical protein